MSSTLESCSKEILIEAADFLKSLWTEGQEGSQLPKFSLEEVREMAAQRFGDNIWLLHIVLHGFREQRSKLSNTVRYQVEIEAASKKLARPLEELLQAGKLGVSAAATVRGRHNLLKWEATGELEYLRQATDLLISAAVNGDPEAYYLLARYRPRQLACVMECHRDGSSLFDPISEFLESRWESKDQSPLHASAPEYLIQDEAERANYFFYAEKAGHDLAFNENEECKLQDIVADVERQEYDATQGEEWLKEDQSETKRREIKIQRLRELPSRSDAQELMLGRLLLEKTAHEFNGIDWDRPLTPEARTCLENASRTLPEARYLLASHHADLPDDEKLDLLRRAAYPEDGVSPYAPAFGASARAHVEQAMLEPAEQALRDQLVFSAAGKWGHDSARYELAEFLRKNRASDPIKGDEALEIYRALSSLSAWCAYCAALMLVERNKLEDAGNILKDARKGKTCTLFDEPDLVTVQTHAKVVDYLGWGEGPLSFEAVVEILLEVLEKSGFKGSEKFLLSPEMASQLMEANPYYRKSQKLHSKEISCVFRST